MNLYNLKFKMINKKSHSLFSHINKLAYEENKANMALLKNK